MDIHQFFELSGWFVGVIGLVYAWYTNRESAKVKDHARAEAWNLYLGANTACGNVQDALRKYKEQHKDHIDPEVLECLSKADAKSLNVYHGAVRQIQWAEPRFDLESVDYWVRIGKVIPAHRENFVKIMVQDGARRNPRMRHRRPLRCRPYQQNRKAMPNKLIETAVISAGLSIYCPPVIADVKDRTSQFR